MGVEYVLCKPRKYIWEGGNGGRKEGGREGGNEGGRERGREGGRE